MLKFKKDNIVINHREGTFDWAVIDEVITNDCYRLKSLKLKPNPVIIDIGAQIGTFSVYAAELFRDSQIFAFEMVNSNYNVLKLNTKDYSNIKINNAAVIGNKKAVGCRFHQTNSGGHSLNFNESNEDIKLIQKQITIKKILSQFNKIDLLKMDCEGSEFEIFKMIYQENLINKIQNIVMEIHLHFGNSLDEILSGLNNFNVETVVNPGDEKLITVFASRR